MGMGGHNGTILSEGTGSLSSCQSGAFPARNHWAGGGLPPPRAGFDTGLATHTNVI